MLCALESDIPIKRAVVESVFDSIGFRCVKSLFVSRSFIHSFIQTKKDAFSPSSTHAGCSIRGIHSESVFLSSFPECFRCFFIISPFALASEITESDRAQNEAKLMSLRSRSEDEQEQGTRFSNKLH